MYAKRRISEVRPADCNRPVNLAVTGDSRPAISRSRVCSVKPNQTAPFRGALALTVATPPEETMEISSPSTVNEKERSHPRSI